MADNPVNDELNDLRKAQDIIDEKIVEAIAERIAMRRKISALRVKHDMPTVDVARIQEVLTQADSLAQDKGVPAALIREVFTILIDWSHKLDQEWRENTPAQK